MEKTIERYYELFTVDYLAGTLRWRASTSTSSRVKVGDRAGGVHSLGYRQVRVDGKRLLEHRVIVAMIEGRVLDADEQVDHENGVRDDNRIENLRIVDRSGNGRNRPCHRAGKPVGIPWRTRQQKWVAQSSHAGRPRYILIHPEQATAARAFKIVDAMLKSGHTFDDAKAAARGECL